MPKGGRREGAGRPPGTPNKRTVEKEQQLREKCADKDGKFYEPLEMMLLTANELYAAGQKREACSIAKDAAPYRHARLQSTEVTGKDGEALDVKLNLSGGDLAQAVLDVLRQARKD